MSTAQACTGCFCANNVSAVNVDRNVVYGMAHSRREGRQQELGLGQKRRGKPTSKHKKTEKGVRAILYSKGVESPLKSPWGWSGLEKNEICYTTMSTFGCVSNSGEPKTRGSQQAEKGPRNKKAPMWEVIGPFGKQKTGRGYPAEPDPCQELVLDVYHPSNRSADRSPAVLLIHGGNFMGSDKQNGIMVSEASICFSVGSREGTYCGWLRNPFCTP